MVAAPVAYSGKLAVNGVNLDGTAQLSFALRDANGTVHWRNGNDANGTIAVPVDRGHYLVLLGGQGMNPLPSDLFLDHPELYLQVRIGLSGNSSLLHLTPDRQITASPHALSAEVARNALVADLAKAVQSGAVTKEMLSPTVLADLNGTITRSRLAADILADLNRTDTNSTITRSRLAADVLVDLNRTITRTMLPADVLSDLNGTISRSRLGADVLADLNATITRSRLAADVLADLNRSIATGSVTRGMLEADVRADLNASLSAASVTAANIHPDLVKYFLPEILVQPVSSAGLKGTNVTLSLSALGKFLTYQWKKNGVNLSGENNATLDLTDANASLHDGNYSVVVGNDWGSVVSNVATFAVATNPPVITLEGNASVTHEGGVAYVDPGATASDALNGNLTAAIVVTGSVDVNETGQNQIKYNVTDAGGNAAAEKMRTVTVVDTTAPVISLIGDANHTHGIGSPWQDPGFTATDSLDGNLSGQVSIAGSVDVNQTGSSTLTYTVSDGAGNAATAVTRTVNVVPVGPWNFTSAGASGRFGPTQAQVDANYSGTMLAGKVTINTQGIQEWTLPATGTYSIEVWGAQGGSTGNKTGGKGARMKGAFSLTKGKTLKILVGQQGGVYAKSASSITTGGGGGTFVVDNNTPLIVAGGGGGSHHASSFYSSNGHNAVTQNYGTTSIGGTGSVNGLGGASPGSFAGGGGGGFSGNGASSSSGQDRRGHSFVNGGVGGLGTQHTSTSVSSVGGFGGGGGGWVNNETRPGGGGGYSGGDGSDYQSPEAGGGGGSYNAGTNQSNTAGANSGHGKVTITFVGN